MYYPSFFNWYRQQKGVYQREQLNSTAFEKACQQNVLFYLIIGLYGNEGLGMWLLKAKKTD